MDVFQKKARVGVLYLASRVSLQSRDVSGQQWEFYQTDISITLFQDILLLMGQFTQLHKIKLHKFGFMCPDF